MDHSSVISQCRLLQKVKCVGNGNEEEGRTKNSDGAQRKDDWIVLPSGKEYATSLVKEWNLLCLCCETLRAKHELHIVPKQGILPCAIQSG